jgi:aryl-alcohol dehydrogenase-like predicted oxidoreductase
MPAWIRRLGRDGPPVSAIGLGLAALGRPGYLNVGHGADIGADRSVDAMRARCWQVLDAARAAGIVYFDAARSYGRAEEFLGGWLAAREIEPGSVTVGSKWGYTYTADWQVDADPPEVKDLSLATFERQIEETRSFLGDHLSLYQIHSATIESGVLDDEAVLGALAELRASGVRVGLSTSGVDQVSAIEHAVALGAFDTVQSTWNLLEPSVGPALARAADAGMGVIVKEAMANGRLADRDSAAIAAAVAQPWASVVLSGASTVAQLESNLRGFVRPEPVAEYWSTREGLEWT